MLSDLKNEYSEYNSGGRQFTPPKRKLLIIYFEF